ncbi:MAG: MBL fold metallo-hydrolase [Bacteroidaceae bacterium]|nr:MBL fold metallo-hydrolase [Bacteroidaceae bacterium]
MMMEITPTIKYIGIDDKDIDLFESQYPVPEGISYNSYIIFDEKIAIMDTADARKRVEWWKNVEETLDGRTPDYLVSHHAEPDHASLIAEVLEKYPAIKIVATAKALQMFANFFEGVDFESRGIAVKEGDILSLGVHTLQFFTAPMVHWPEVIVTYEQSEKILFSADAFGKFGALCCDDSWECEARRYYINICGKYGNQVQALLKKAATLDIRTICPLHGPILTENLGHYINLYNIWSKYEPESKGVFIPYASIYGGTAAAAEALAEIVRRRGVEAVTMDLCRNDVSYAIEDAFRYSHMVVCAASYDADLFPPMHSFLHHLKLKNFQNRKVAVVENGTWAPTAGRVMRAMLEGMKSVEIVEPVLTIRSRMSKADTALMEQLAGTLLA